MKKAPYIHWTDAEREAIVCAMTQIIRDNKERRVSSTELLRDSQEKALPASRRRRPVGGTISSMVMLIDRARKAAAAGPSEAPIEKAIEAPAGTLPQPTHQSPSLGPYVEALANVVVQRLTQAVADAVFAKVERLLTRQALDALSATVAEAAQQPRHDPTPKHEPGAARPGVLIIGLLAAQAAHVIEEFPDLDITHMTGEEAHNRHALRRAHTILMPKFISHAVQDKYRRVENLRLCPGGLTELSNLLTLIKARNNQ